MSTVHKFTFNLFSCNTDIQMLIFIYSFKIMKSIKIIINQAL